jgi:DNA polymerase III subunit epsilon
MRQVVLDTETTGLSPKDGHRIIEIGCVELIDRRITGNDFHVYINPERLVDAEAEAVHGLGNEFLSSKPLFASIVEDFLAYVKGSELLIHNAPFDVGFLNHELGLLSPSGEDLSQYCTVVDTLELARDEHPGARNSLDALCKRYDVDNSSRDLHGALLDADLLAKVYLAMTGGQCHLFAGAKDEAQGSHAGILGAMAKGDWDIPVLELTEKEQSLHDQYLAKMAETKDVVWQ